VIPVDVISVIVNFTPLSHANGAVAPAIFEMTIWQAMHRLELVVVRPQEPSGFGRSVQICLKLVVAIPQIVDFKILGSQRSPEPPYFANQSGTILNAERSLPVDVLLKLLQSFDFHGALSIFKSEYSSRLAASRISLPTPVAKREEKAAD
jgi:hypothetical protein